MQISLEDQVILITGGSEGIGKQIALQTAQCGAKVAVIARHEDDLKKVVSQIESDGGTAIWASADVTSSDQMKAAVEKVLDRFGRLDGVVANAGTNGTWKPIDEMTPEEWRSTIDVNLTGTYITIHHCVPHLRRQGKGSIVVMASINGTRTFSHEGASAYAASKAGQTALAQMLALELAKSKIRVNVVCPGAIDSEIHEKTNRQNLEKIQTRVEYPDGKIPLVDGPFGDPEHVANLTAFLLSDLSGHITGTPIWIDGGQSLIS